mgnify:CR=1 FL=1
MNSRGFSLVEMLVVLFVVVLITGLATLGINTGMKDRESEEFLADLVASAEYALDEARFSGSDFGLLVARDPARAGEGELVLLWRQRFVQGWRSPAGDAEIFRPRPVPDGIELELTLDEQAVAPQDENAADEANSQTPQWLFVASGETSAGELVLRSRETGERVGRLTWDALGRFETYHADDEEPLSAYTP